MTEHARITTRFSRDTTADEVVRSVDLAGKRAVVTGGASGIGVETARSLARAGAEVTLAVRTVEAGRAVAADITATTGNPGVHVAALELTASASVASFAASWKGPLHILVNNAGVMALPGLQRTSEGWEYQFATNHLGHFRLALALQPALAAAEGARIVAVSSSGHLASPLVFDDIHFTHRAYDPWLAYGQSKTANALFAVEAHRRWSGLGITANALMPGGIRTALQRHLDDSPTDPEQKKIFEAYPWRTARQGAATSVLLAASPLVEGIGGRYFENCNEALPGDVVPADGEADGVAAHALDPRAARHLWQVSEDLLAS
ncbi:SDR family NAD(P)-dependent oxidoreductase [Streptomyces sp. NPDC006296]|uniref:SDR family NAD(P)-dependent oxidoreductase n=1 Tax=Streptomyces sp. NPDC006296 TaxID=3156746 RepID=UPI0033A31D18